MHQTTGSQPSYLVYVWGQGNFSSWLLRRAYMTIYRHIIHTHMHIYTYIHTPSHMYTYAHIHTHIGIYVLTKHTLTYISTQLSLYIYNYLIIILLSNDSSKLPFVFYGYILKTAVAQVHTAPIQTQVGMAGLTPACVKSQNQRLAELSLSHHPAHSVCWLQRSVLPFAQALCPLSQRSSFHFIFMIPFR